MKAKRKNSGRPAKNAKRERVYSSHIGRPKEDPAVRAAETAAAQALIQLSRSGTGVVFRRSEAKYLRDGLVRAKKRPRRTSDSGLARLLHVGSDARGIRRLAAGARVLTRDKGVHAVEQLIHHALLPGYATWLVPLDYGHARLLAPFQPFFRKLRKVGPCGLPPSVLQERLARYVRRYRSALRDLTARENAERKAFQKARDDLIRALLLLRRRMRVSNNLKGDVEIRSLARCAALRATKLLGVVHSMNSLQVQIRPSPRESAAQWAGALFPASAPEGGPDFSALFTWLALNVDSTNTDLHSAIAVRRELVGGSWWARLHPSYRNDPEPRGAQWRMVGLHVLSPVEKVERFVPAEPDEVTEPDDFSEVYRDENSGESGGGKPATQPRVLMEGVPKQDLRFVRHLRRVVGEVGLRAMLLFAMTDRWFGVGADADMEEGQTEFESDLFALCAWVRSVYPGRSTLTFEKRLSEMGYSLDGPSTAHDVAPAFLKQLIYKLSRTFVRRPVEMNLDLPVLPAGSRSRAF